MSGSEHARPVWLNRHDRYEIEAAMILAGAQQENGERLCPAAASTLRELLASWDAAPADPAEAVLDAISTEWMNTGMGNEERIDDVYNREGAAIYRKQAVLRALGHPKEPA